MQALTHLQLVLEFMPRADTKAQYIIAASTAMLGVLAVNLPGFAVLSWLALVVLPPLVVLTYAIYSAFRALMPSLRGGTASLVYFSSIAEMSESTFLDQYLACTEAQFDRELAAQVWRNSTIARIKFKYVQSGFVALGFGIALWVVALLVIVVGYGSTDRLISFGA